MRLPDLTAMERLEPGEVGWFSLDEPPLARDVRLPDAGLGGVAWVAFRGDTVRLRSEEPCPFCGFTGTFDGHVCEDEWSCRVYGFLIRGRGGIPVRWTP